MNTWKIAFWSSIVALILVIGFSAYTIIDQAYAITYQNVSYTDISNDLDQLIEVVNQTKLTKTELENALKNHHLYRTIDFNSDTISINQMVFVFEGDILKSVTRL